MSHLSAEQQNILQIFQEVSQITDEYLSIQILQQNGWNLDQSLGQFVNDQSDNQRNGLAATNSALRRSVSATTNNSTTSSRNRSLNSQNENDTNNGPLSPLLLPLRWLFQSRPLSLNPQRDTLKFIDDFDLEYRSRHPTFHENSYQSAVAQAFTSSKFLIVYLHSPMHEDTHNFCTQILCSPRLIQLANEYAVTWVGKIWDPEAYGLSGQLKVTSYPFVALLVCQSARMVQVAKKFEGIFRSNLQGQNIFNCKLISQVWQTSWIRRNCAMICRLL